MRAKMLWALALAALLPLASADAQPRSKETPKAKPKAAKEQRVDAGDWCCGMGPGAGMGFACGPGMAMGPRSGRGRGGPGWHARGGGFGGPGAAWGGRGRGLMRGEGRLARDLKLTDDQQRKLRDLRSAHRRAMVGLRAELEVARLDLREAMRDDAPEARIEQRIDALVALQAKHMKAMAQHRLEMRSILTPEQRGTLRDLRPGGRFGGDGEDEGEFNSGPTAARRSAPPRAS